MKDTQTRVIVISPDSILTPEVLRNTIIKKYKVTVKETCFGVYIEGTDDKLKDIVDDVRELDKNGIFSKSRGFPIGDVRVCRSTRKGGPRPGFHQLDAEYKLLPRIRAGLDAMDRGEEIPQVSDKGKIDIKILSKIIEET